MVTTRAKPTLPTLGRLPLPVLGAALLVLLALITQGGNFSQLSTQVPTAWVDVALIVAGGVAVAALVIAPRRGAGTLTLSLFAALTALTALSIAWSVVPDQSWEESGRTVAYLAAFTVALVAARASGGVSRGAIGAVTLAAVALCVWALAVKVFNLDLYAQRSFGRLVAPSGYWNATGLTGALALPGLIWQAARRGRGATAGLAVAGIAIAVSVVALSYSRSAVAAALFGCVVPLCFLRARRRSVVMLGLGLLGAVPICLFALLDNTISDDGPGSSFGDGVAHLDRLGAGLVLAAIIVVVCAFLVAAGTLLTRRLDAQPQPAARLRAFDRGLLALVLAVPVAIVLWLIFNHRGPTGEISHLWDSLTANNPDTGDHVSRLGTLDNSRSAYWRQALSVGKHHLAAGAGAGSFYPALQSYADATLTPVGNTAHDAHSYVLDNFASFGLIGIALNLALFCAWWRNAIVAVATRRARLSSATDPNEIDARWALIGVVIAFGASSSIDYTWYFPGLAVPALIAAGWLAGVGAPVRGVTAQHATAGPARPAVAPVRSISTRPGAILALTALAAVTLAVAWESLQPMRSVQSAGASQNALLAGDGSGALADAHAAVSQDPLSANALATLATADEATGQPIAALTALVKATQVQRHTAQPFARLGGYLLCRGDFSAAEIPLRRAQMLDITDSDRQNEALADARARRRRCGVTI